MLLLGRSVRPSALFLVFAATSGCIGAKSGTPPSVVRVHPLSGYGKPTLWKLDVYANRSWQVTFELNDGTASLKRIATHKAIDRDPRGD